MQTRRLPLDESDHIARTQVRQLACSVAETMFEETPDMRHVVDDGRLSQHALFTQIAREFSCALLNWVRPRFGRLFHGNDSLAVEELNQVSQRRCVALVNLNTAGSISQILHSLLRPDAVHSHVLLAKPMAETRCEKYLSTQRAERISLLVYPSCK